MLFSGGTVPYYLVLTELNLTNTIWVYIIPSLYSVTNILLLRTSFNQLPFLQLLKRQELMAAVSLKFLEVL